MATGREYESLLEELARQGQLGPPRGRGERAPLPRLGTGAEQAEWMRTLPGVVTVGGGGEALLSAAKGADPTTGVPRGKILRALQKLLPKFAKGAATGLTRIPHPIARGAGVGLLALPGLFDYLASKTSPHPTEQAGRGLFDLEGVDPEGLIPGLGRAGEELLIGGGLGIPPLVRGLRGLGRGAAAAQGGGGLGQTGLQGDIFNLRRAADAAPPPRGGTRRQNIQQTLDVDVPPRRTPPPDVPTTPDVTRPRGPHDRPRTPGEELEDVGQQRLDFSEPASMDVRDFGAGASRNRRIFGQQVPIKPAPGRVGRRGRATKNPQQLVMYNAIDGTPVSPPIQEFTNPTRVQEIVGRIHALLDGGADLESMIIHLQAAAFDPASTRRIRKVIDMLPDELWSQKTYSEWKELAQRLGEEKFPVSRLEAVGL